LDAEWSELNYWLQLIYFLIVCLQPLYTVDLMENVAVGSYVIRVSATDADEPGTRNSRMEFSLESDDLDLFSVHKKSGTTLISTNNINKTYKYTVDLLFYLILFNAHI